MDVVLHADLRTGFSFQIDACIRMRRAAEVEHVQGVHQRLREEVLETQDENFIY